MSVAPIQVGATNKTLQGVAYVVSGGLVTGVKTDIVVADIDTLYVRRDQTTAITISSDGTGMTDKVDQDDAHSDGAVWNAGGGKLIVDVPDTAFAVYAPDVELYGTWTDGSDSGIIRGTPVALTNGYTWATFGATILNRIGAFTGTGVNTILGFFKAIMFSDATEPSDAGDTFAASMEENLAATQAGAVAVLPYSATGPSRQEGTDLFLYTGETNVQTVTVRDSNQELVDLSAKTLVFTVRENGTQVQSGSVTGNSSGVFTYTPVSDLTDAEKNCNWSLRDTANGNEIIAHGHIVVREAAIAD